MGWHSFAGHKNDQPRALLTHEKINGHRELTVSSPWAHGDHGGHGTGTQWSRLSHDQAKSQRGHSEVTARSQLSRCEVTAQSRLSHG